MDTSTRMELRHLRYFLTVARHLSFTRAAAELRVTQPTLSHQIRQLEQSLGTPLFDRVGRRVRLTAPGKLFHQHVERALEALHAGTAALGELQGLMRGTLSIGAFQSFNSTLLPSILSEFSTAYPGIHVTVRQLATGDIEECLAKGEIDFGIAYMPPGSDRIVAEKLFDEPLMLIVGEGHRLAGRREVHLSRLNGEPLALMTEEFPSRRLVESRFAAVGVRPDIRIEINSTDAILATVRHGRLATMQTERMARAVLGLRCIRLRPRMVRTVAVFWPREGFRSAAARAAVEMIRQAYRNSARTDPGGEGLAAD
ncbi:MAG TPA: transcriptional regulator CynR [Burkholderiales bacterium]|nr:transcriptional regulator CynR [Burkholderiales bacterium]